MYKPQAQRYLKAKTRYRGSGYSIEKQIPDVYVDSTDTAITHVSKVKLNVQGVHKVATDLNFKSQQ